MPDRNLDILFFLRGIHYDRVFENFFRALLERGHRVHVALVQEKRGRGEDKTRLFDEFASRYSFTYENLPRRRDPWVIVAMALRHGLDYLRYLEPEYAHTDPLRDRARERAPRLLQWITALPLVRGRTGRRIVRTTLRGFEGVLPVPRRIRRLVKAHAPDVVLVSPLIGLGSIEGDYVRAAETLGIPTVLPVASWDNLTNKGLIRDVPTLTIVWNETQVDEAERHHHIPRDRVVAVGAHSFDHWFTWEPSTTREEFAARRGLDPERPLVLYVGSSWFISGDETGFIREWVRRVREHPRLREVAVIVRPHPQNLVGWRDLDLDERGKTVVWPRRNIEPRGMQQKLDYFDSIFHSQAMVGISTSAMVEAAILRKPTLTLATGQFAAQEGTLHFAYIAPGGDDGLVSVARDWDEHLDQVADAVETPQLFEARIDAFVGQFLRPNGPGPAAPAAAAAVERAAATEVVPRRVLAAVRTGSTVLTPLLWAAVPLFHPRQTWRQLTKAAQQWTKRARRARRRAVRVFALVARAARRTLASFRRRRGWRSSSLSKSRVYTAIRRSRFRKRLSKRLRRFRPASRRGRRTMPAPTERGVPFGAAEDDSAPSEQTVSRTGG